MEDNDNNKSTITIQLDLMIHEFKSTNIKRCCYIFAAISLMVIVGSGCDKGKNIPDVSNIKVDLEVVRFEKEMYGVDSSRIPQKAADLIKTHPEFSEIYTNIMRERNQRDSSELFVMDWLMRGPQLKMLYDTCMALYDDFSEYENQLTESMKYYKYYFPEKEVPRFYTCITEFAYQGFSYGEDIVAIGVEHYMGKDFPAYRSIFPYYQYSKFTPEHLISSTMEVLAGELSGEYKEVQLLDAMIQNGKKLYLMDLLMPYAPDSVKLQMTDAQAEWCMDNEFEIWTFFVNEDLVFNSKKRDYMKYILPGPHSPGMPPDAPGRTANFTGWQIIKKYMKQNPHISLQEMLDNKDARKILKASKYRGES